MKITADYINIETRKNWASCIQVALTRYKILWPRLRLMFINCMSELFSGFVALIWGKIWKNGGIKMIVRLFYEKQLKVCLCVLWRKEEWEET